MNTRKLLVSALLLVCVLLAACVPATIAPPTATVMPSTTPTSAPTIINSTADLLGTWQAILGDGFRFYLIFNEDGTLVVTQGPTLADAVLRARGNYHFNGNQLVITSTDFGMNTTKDCSDAGVYNAVQESFQWETKPHLKFQLIQDTCPDRIDYFDAKWQWKLIEP